MVGKGIDGLTYLDKMELPQAGDVSAPVEEPGKPTPSDEAKPATQGEAVRASETPSAGIGSGSEVVSHAATAAGRERYGLDEMRKAAAQSFGKSWQLGQAKLARNPNYIQKIVDKLSKKPDVLNAEDHAALIEHVLQTTSEVEDAMRCQNENPGDAGAKSILEGARERLNKAYTAAENAGTATGQALNIRKMMKAREWSLCSGKFGNHCIRKRNHLSRGSR
jgi:hypothetical protein